MAQVPSSLTHVRHCCERHGCKYGMDYCPVVKGVAPQRYPCEICDSKEGQIEAFAIRIRECQNSVIDMERRMVYSLTQQLVDLILS